MISCYYIIFYTAKWTEKSICDCRAVTQATTSSLGGLAVRGKSLEVEDLIIKELSPKQHAVNTSPKPHWLVGCEAKEMWCRWLLGSAKLTRDTQANTKRSEGITNSSLQQAANSRVVWEHMAYGFSEAMGHLQVLGLPGVYAHALGLGDTD